MKIGGAELSPVSPCRPWCEVPDLEESGVDPEHLALTHPAWCCDKANLADPDQRARMVWAALAASSLLFRMSDLRYNGGCTSEEVLCLRMAGGCCRLGWGDDWRSRPVPTGDGLTWQNIGCGRSSCDCSTAGRRIVLPYGPVVSIESVTIDDELIPDDAYRLVDGSIYFCDAVPGDLCFDACSGAGLRVAWTWGQAPPPDGITAACVYACELYKSCAGQPCQIPRGLRKVTKPGVSFDVLNPLDFLEKGRTGITEVDAFLASLGGAPSTVIFPEDVAPIDFAARARARW